MPPDALPIFTDMEIEKMRLFVTQHDKRNVANVFDLNNPPKPPYTHQEFPRLMYKLHDEGHQVHHTVQNAKDHRVALDAGWSNTPVAPAEPEELAVDPAAAAEAAQIDAQLAAARKKKR